MILTAHRPQENDSQDGRKKPREENPHRAEKNDQDRSMDMSYP